MEDKEKNNKIFKRTLKVLSVPLFTFSISLHSANIDTQVLNKEHNTVQRDFQQKKDKDENFLEREFKRLRALDDILTQDIMSSDPKNGLANLGYYFRMKDECRKYGIDPVLFKLIIDQESKWKPDAVSRKGAIGLAQLMPSTAKDFGVKKRDLYKPEKNLSVAAEYFAKLLRRYKGDVEKSLAAYNSGPGNVDKYNGIPPFKETRKYVKNIMGKYKEIMGKIRLY